jgi:hypothetical protein
MELDFTEFDFKKKWSSQKKNAEKEGYIFEFLQHKHIEKMRKIALANWMLNGLKNPFSTSPNIYPYVVCREKENIIGFCGELSYDKTNGMGGFSFIYRDKK